jgi:predicted permease
MRRLLLRLISRIAPVAVRERWLEEWRAEVRHGGWRMVPGAIPDALTLRRLPGNAPTPRAPIFHALDQDLRYALRSFASGRSFTLAVVGSLAIGIAATTAAFAMVNAVLFRSFPAITGQEDLVRVTIGPRQRVWFSTSWQDAEVLRQGIAALDGFSIAHSSTFAVAPGGGQEPRVVDGLVVSGNYFDVLGVRPALGRFFTPADDGAPWQQPAVVVSYRYWQRHMSGDTEVLQRTINVNGTGLPIIGVAPEGFGGVFTAGDAQVWVTFALSDLVFRDAEGRPIHARAAKPFHTTLIGRLKPGATIEQAQAQATALAAPLYEANKRGERELFVRVEPLRIADPSTYWLRAVALMVVPMIVLAIACVNAANLLLARATRRSQDWLVRLALGASRWRLVRQMLVESLLLAFGGAAVGLGFSFWTTRYVQQFVAARDIVIDVNVVLFVVAAAVATALVFGLGPALSVTRAAVAQTPEAGRFLRGPFGSRTRAALVVLQAALCLGLLATGAQFTKTLQTLADEGLPEPGQFLVVSVDVDKLRYDRARTEAFYADLLARVEQLPSVTSAALTGRSAASMLRGLVSNWGLQVSIGGQPEGEWDRSLVTYATGGFFDAMGLQISKGRTFTAAERRGPPRTVIVNEPFAKRFGEDALGRVVHLSTEAAEGADTGVDAMIVGVVAAAPGRPLFDRLPNVFYPAPLVPEPARDVVVRFDGDAQGIAAAVRTIVSGMDARLPLSRVATGEELRRLRNTYEHTLVQAVSILGILSLVLAAAGLYGVVSYMVTMRQKEIGIRMALGAQGTSVLRMVVRQTLMPVLVGCVLGAAGAVIAGSLVRSRLYGVSPMDPIAFSGAALLLILTMILATLAPARRAARVDPIQVLRTE